MDTRDPMIRKSLYLRTLNDSKDPNMLPLIQQIKKENKLCRFCWKNGETEVSILKCEGWDSMRGESNKEIDSVEMVYKPCSACCN